MRYLFSLLFVTLFFNLDTYSQLLPSMVGAATKKGSGGAGGGAAETRNFTNCSSTGINGPLQSDCNTAYASDDLNGEVTVTNGIQEWTVPTTGSYVIEVWGARGGYTGGCHSSQLGGTLCHGANGARMKGTFNLTQGDILRIAVGQMGEDYSSGSSGGGGGGGGTFVAVGNNHSGAIVLIVSGGGGGGHYYSNQVAKGGQTTESGLGNTSTGHSYKAGGGGSWSSDGADGTFGSTGGKGWANLLVGGTHSTFAGNHWSKGDGGFGGGGGGNWPPGNGGGYNGGPQVRCQSPTFGGSGGGSYNSGSSQDNTAGAWNSHGKVTITW